jgi:hypothetical protein
VQVFVLFVNNFFVHLSLTGDNVRILEFEYCSINYSNVVFGGKLLVSAWKLAKYEQESCTPSTFTIV